jgi:predicted PurR-regulated permease PerM
MFLGSAIQGIRDLGTQYSEGNLTIPSPNPQVKDWPLVGETLYESWELASENLGELISKYETQLSSFGQFLLDSLLGTGLGYLQLIFSVIISGALLAASGTKELTQKLFNKVAGSFGEEFASIAEQTIKNVVKGIFGVAAIQAVFAGFGFLMARVPYPGLWALLVLILTVIQIGPTIIIIPIVIWLFNTQSIVFASLWSIYLIAVMLMDNILKPILLGKGAPVPMLVIFLGAIGGFMYGGFLGMFLGAIILSLGYKLFMAWLNQEESNI